MSIQALFLVLALAAAIGVGFAVFYQRGYERGFAAGIKQGEEGTIKLLNVTTLHRLAANGFERLLLLGLREPHSGFQTREQAWEADRALGHLEYYLPKDEVKPDYEWDRMTSITTRWPTDRPPHPAHQLVQDQSLAKEP